MFIAGLPHPLRFALKACARIHWHPCLRRLEIPTNFSTRRVIARYIHLLVL